MSFISDRLKSIKPSATLALTQKAAELKASGKPILSLTAGEPDFATPKWVCEAAHKAALAGQTHYTPVGGTTEMKEAILQKLKKDNGLDLSLENILVSCGAKHSIFNALMASLNPGDEVLISAPYWVSYPDMVTLSGGTPKIVSCPESEGFKITPSILEKAITPRTKWLILNSPSNPTGATYTKEELCTLGEILEKHPQIHILSDEIYEHLIYEGTFTSFAEANPGLASRTLTINGVSKAYAMTGWRIGYAAGPKELIKAMGKLQSQSTSNPCSIAQAAAISALTGPQEILKEWGQIFKKRRDLLVEGLNTIDGISCLKPTGAFYVYPSVAGLIGRKTPQGQTLENDSDISKYFLDHVFVATVPGMAFGLSPHLRLSYATSEETLSNALQQLQKAVSDLC
ncbi:MAG: pyridoxal phosphate-dependent aminotransferase [bacterium]|nr:pyridoxal phosphate-dependent aminotransferase [bacterium]